ncbi:MAG: phage major capsid protein [Pseudobutyrivibrio sp.]|nr:phage major capsid protein [Pseudobutyrivibrio sp.]
MSRKKYDFSGWATRNDIKCADGLTIRQDAFADCDGATVPLVYMHDHKDPENVLGHAILENREDGVYCYGSFNDTEKGEMAKALVAHGDITSLSIYANQLVKRGTDVLHGAIREVSLVLAGANPGATIDFPVLQHSDGSYEDVEDEAIISYKQPLSLSDELNHSFEEANDEEANNEEEISHAEESDDEPTVQEVMNTMDKNQKMVLEGMMEIAYEKGLEDAGKSADNNDKDEEVSQSDINEEGDKIMHNNVFEKKEDEKILQHGIDVETASAILTDARESGASLKATTLAHSIDQIDWLFPEAKAASATPEFIKRDTGWVSGVLNGVHHTPYSRIKSHFADIREDEARARGYIKDEYKKEEVFSLLKRTTTPQTIYKKQKLDRDDIIDITDFDVVAWIKAEMRMMLDEEIARAIMIGDGRLASSDDKISEQHIRPIWKDDELYSVKVKVTYAAGADDNAKAQANIKAMIKNRKLYKGSGNPKFYTTEDVLADMLLITDTTGRFIYESVQNLANKLRVSEIVTVPVFDNQIRSEDGHNYALLGIMVNLSDYNVGADKGGAVNMFDDFDIDYNKETYLIETRISGALTVPFSALVLETEVTNG